MIAPMEKVTVLIFHKAKADFLKALQELGLLHISEEAREGSPDELKKMKKRIKRADAFLKTAQKEQNKQKQSDSNVDIQHRSDDAFSYVSVYEQIEAEITENSEKLEKIEREIRNLEPWGDFDYKSIEKLAQVGVHIRFFITPLKKFAQCQDHEDIYLQEISRDKTYVYFVVFEKNKKAEIDCDEFFYPQTDMKTLQAQRDKLALSIEKARQRNKELFRHKEEVFLYRNAQQSMLRYVSISTNLPTAVENTVYIIRGWTPVSLKENIKEFLEKHNAYYYFSKPQSEEDVPVLLKNNRFTKLFEPITKLFSLPDYAELDLTAFFAPFFTLFFGFCLGDAGYGLIIFIGAFIARFKLKENKKPIASLLMILGMSTFFFGLITGNLFGIDLAKMQGIKKIVLFNSDQLFNVALILGVIQVFFGMFIKAVNRIRQFGFMASLSTFGWIIMLGGLGGLTVYKDSIYIVFFGMALILLFNDLKSNIFIRIGKGLWELYGITGIFGDLLSYIRLFALGISSSILGIVVNDIALGFRSIPGYGFILTFLVLVIGHTGNMLLGALSSFVHPLRLTFVEFYKSAGFTGGGKAYNPFRHIT